MTNLCIYLYIYFFTHTHVHLCFGRIYVLYIKCNSHVSVTYIFCDEIQYPNISLSDYQGNLKWNPFVTLTLFSCFQLAFAIYSNFFSFICSFIALFSFFCFVSFESKICQYLFSFLLFALYCSWHYNLYTVHVLH